MDANTILLTGLITVQIAAIIRDRFIIQRNYETYIREADHYRDNYNKALKDNANYKMTNIKLRSEINRLNALPEVGKSEFINSMIAIRDSFVDAIKEKENENTMK